MTEFVTELMTFRPQIKPALAITSVLLSHSLFSPGLSQPHPERAEDLFHHGGEHRQALQEYADASHGADHPVHGTMEIPAGMPIPAVELSVSPDPMGGWNLHAKVTHFEFVPERVNQESGATEGHAHLYINGEKITRLYSPWYYIPQLEPGEHEITVVLNTNGHQTLSNQGDAIADTVILQVPEAGTASH